MARSRKPKVTEISEPSPAEPATPARISPMVETAVGDPADTRTHIERINPGDNPAYIPGAWPAADKAPGGDPLNPGVKRRYRLLQTGIHNNARMPAGSVVELYDHEVGAHHELIPEDKHRAPSQREEPDRVHRHALKAVAEPKPKRGRKRSS